MTNFKSYMHVERLSSQDCVGILDNDVVNVTAKIDATNACVWYDEEKKQLRAGSRKREVNLEKDNAGFAEWIENSEDNEVYFLLEVCRDHPQWIVYGEWMAKFVGQIKDYNQEAKYHMYIFDVYDREKGYYLSDQEWRTELTGYGLGPWFVELLATLDHPTMDDIAKIAKNNKFLLDNANHPGEGVVVKAPGWINQYGHQVYGKLVLDEYQQEKKKNKTVRVPGDIELEIIDLYVTTAELAKTYHKIVTANNVEILDVKNGKHVGMFISTVWHDLLQEAPNFVKKFRNPTIDFAALNGLCNIKSRQYLGLA